jgi:FKBP-type peptidyl-prolyl cis-trans isomerase FkpA
MPSLIICSLLTLVVVFVGAKSCGLTPRQIEDRVLLAELNSMEGAGYWRARADQPGVASLPNGLLVEVLREGSGDVPAKDDWVQLHYRGWHIDGREFDSSWRRDEPATLPVERAIAGWQQVLVAAPVGSLLRLVVPPELAYGRSGAGIIGPEETLEFEIELLAIVVPQAPPEREAWELPVPNLR